MKNKIKLSLLLILLLSAAPLSAQMICPIDNSPLKPKEVKSLAAFEKIAILDQGRIKPLDTYAQNTLLRFSGKRSFQRKPAIQWLARLLFAPETTRKDKVFLINNPEIAQAFKIEPEMERRYNFDELEKHYEKLIELAQAAAKIDEKERSLVDQEILRIQVNLELYTKLSQSFLFAFPHDDFMMASPQLKTALGFAADTDQFSFIDIVLRADKIYQASAGLERKSESQWTPDDKNLSLLMNNLYRWALNYRDLPLTILPAYSQNNEGWISPWDAFNKGFQTEDGREELSLLRALMVTYWNGQELEFDLAARSFNDSLKKRFEHPKILEKIPLEIFYNKLNLFLIEKFCYGFAFLIFLFSLMSEKKIFYRLAVSLIIAGFVPFPFSRAIRLPLPGADSMISEEIPFSAKRSRTNSAARVSSPGGLEVSIRIRSWRILRVSDSCPDKVKGNRSRRSRLAQANLISLTDNKERTK